MRQFSLFKSKLFIILTVAAGLFFTALIYRNFQIKKLTPQTQIPYITAENETADWKTYTVDLVNLTFKAPAYLFVQNEVKKNTAGRYELTLFIQNYDDTHRLPSGGKIYQLYGISQSYSTYTQADLDARQKEYVPSSIRNITVAGYPGIQGQFKGERNRYITEFIKDGALFSLMTADPVPENEALSNQILSTFQFLDNSIIPPKPTSIPTKKLTPAPTPSPTPIPTPTPIPVPTLNASVGEEFSFTVPFNGTEGVESKPYYDSSYLQFLHSQVNEPGKSDTYETFYFKALRTGETNLTVSQYRWPGNQEVRHFTYKVIIQP